MHEFNAHLIWDGNRGDGTSSYRTYGRDYRALIDGKPELAGSAAKEFRGDGSRHNPEDLFLSAISACHMLTYLALCANAGISVVAYEDDAVARMSVEPSGGGRFVEVTLRPRVTIARGGDHSLAEQLHERAHGLCFIANSCSVPIRHVAATEVQE